MAYFPIMMLAGPLEDLTDEISGALGQVTDQIIDRAWGELDARVTASIPGWTETAMQSAAASLPAAIEEIRPQIEDISRQAVRAALDSEAFRQKLGFEKQRVVIGAVLAVGVILAGTAVIVHTAK